MVLTLGPSTSSPLSWKLVDYSRQLLMLVHSDPRSGHFEFVARAAGTGEVKAAVIAECGPPFPAAMAVGAGCPVGGNGQSGSVPLRRFSVTVEVT